MELFKNQNGRLLRYGYTTGSCAAAASKAAASMLLGGTVLSSVTLTTPIGVCLMLELHDVSLGSDLARCAVKKDGGDDPDVTHGLLVYSSVRRIPSGIVIKGGEGVGRVTKPGLDQPVGAAAINSTPRKMITEELTRVCAQYGYGGGLEVAISIPGGEELAQRTFNPRLGIEGGISVIGTTGIVEPMSSRAIAETLRLEIRQLAAAGSTDILLTPGNYGSAFAKGVLGLSLREHVACSNYIGEAIDAAVEYGFRRILLIGHIGKFVKLGIGVTNTHSSFGDGRMETLAACALEAGAALPLLKSIMGCVTADAALELIYGAGLLSQTMSVLNRRIYACLSRRVPQNVEIGYICFSNSGPYAGVLMQSDNAAIGDTWR